MVINHPAAALCIHPPMFETTVAVQTTAKAVCLNGLSVVVSRLRTGFLRSFPSSVPLGVCVATVRGATVGLLPAWGPCG
jgi:hypothetical protein